MVVKHPTSATRSIWRRIKLRYQLILLFVVLTLIPLILFGFLSNKIMGNEIVKLAEKNMAEIVQKNNSILDARFRDITDSALLLNVDSDIYDVFSSLNPDDPYSLLLANKRVAEVLRRYFGRFNEMYSVHLVTSYFRFGEEDKNFYPTGSFVRSRLYSAAEKARGALVWMPTYDYIEMFGLEDIYRTIPLDYRNVFSAVKVLNVSTVRNGTIKSLPLNAERPILVLNFREEFLRTTFLSTTSPSSDFYQNYQMLTKDGHVVSDRDASRLGSSISEVWLDKIGSAASGTILTRTGGKENIVCYSVSDVTGWVSAITVPTSLFTAAILGTASRFVLSIYLLAIIVTAFISFGTSRIITRRIHELLKPIERIGNGEFDHAFLSDPDDEFGFFYDKLNAMNENLKTLIHENYVVKLREREAAVHMLNVQLNPHFLYNTINIINWTALRGEASQTSKMLVGLARMLQYTSDKHSEMASLHEDMDWIQRYVYIMKMRFEGLFTLELDIEPGLLELQIPKLLLQPLVENSIMHGFKGMREGGRVIISGAMEDGRVVLSVEDNGCGMSDEKIRAVMTNPRESIGIANVDKRVKLLYGEGYGVEIHSEKSSGTIVSVFMPCGQA